MLIVFIVFLLLIGGLITESWKLKFRRVGAYSIVLCIHDIIIYSMMISDSKWLNVIFVKNVYGTIKNDNYILTLFCYIVSLLCGVMFYNYDKIKNRRMLLVCCIIHMLLGCIIFSHFQSTGAFFLIVSAIPYGIGLYQCYKESNL